MKDKSASSVNRDGRLAEVLDANLAALEAGKPPDVEELLARHPDLAGDLRECLASLAFIRRAEVRAGRVADDGDAPPQGEAAGGMLGDFRILREVGRGGMGVVYEAEQVSLGRRVALKVLPFAATMDPRHLQRFHNEARAAASLDHPHIVKVHAVGQERGVHYFAMKFIEGRSLAELIEAQRQGSVIGGNPSPGGMSDQGADACRSLADATQPIASATAQSAPRDATHYRRIAEWGIQAAEALEHAHGLGIVHRDIKPGNLMIDGAGRLWVTDFGLARTVTDAGLTMSGDLLGTLRYMSPEQALARHGLMDHRTDIYSLGATLYELLTGRPAVEGQDRQLILRRIADEEPRPPRAWNRAIPADLGTIVLKAMAKAPADRYATAQELADDLRRFLEDKSIKAKRPTWVQRTWRWARRHRPVVATGAISLLVSLAGAMAALTISTARITYERNCKEDALQQVDEQLQEAERQRLIAKENFQRACALLYNAPLKHQLEWLSSQERNSRADHAAEQNALALFQSLLTEPGPDPGDRMLMAEVHRELGDIHLARERRGKALAEYQKAIVLLRRLLEEFPREAGFRDSLAHCFWQTGQMRLPDPAHWREGEDAFEQAISLYESLRQEFGDVPWYRLQLAQCWGDLGELRRRRQERFAEGEEALRRALALRQQLLDEFPQRWDQRGPMARIHKDLAWVMAIRSDRKPHHASEALEHARKAVELEPEDHDVWHTLGVAHYRMGHWKDALECIEKSRQIENKPEPPDSFDRFFEAMAYWQLGDRDKARRCYDEAVQWMEKHEPNHSDLRRFQIEAADLLQIQVEKTRPQGHTENEMK
jgi:serine/threonine protein kinase